MTTSLQPGEIIKGAQDYEILGHLGAGGMGSIYRARDMAHGDQVAIKMVIPPDNDDADSLLERLLKREATTLRQIDHRAVVRYRDFVMRRDGAKLLVMDLVPGPTLREHVRRTGPLSWEAWLLLRDRLASGLAAVHDRGIIHRDLSPDNIILRDGRPDRPVLIDFGVARDRHATGGTIIGDRRVGKYLYASPEQLLDPTAVSAASDLYSLALVLAFAARGTALAMGENEREAIERRRALPDLDGLDERVRRQLSLLLQPRIEQRPRSVEGFLAQAEDDEPAVETTQPAAPPAGTAPAAARGSAAWMRGPWIPILAVVMTIALSAGGILHYLRADPAIARQQEWAALRESRDLDKLAAFAGRYPGTPEGEAARRRVDELKPKPVIVTPPAPQPTLPPLQPAGPAPMRAPIASFNIYFDYDSAVLRPEVSPVIQQVAARYRAATSARTILLTANIDESLPADRGTQLAQRMADAVRTALIRAGIPAGVIVTKSQSGGSALDEAARAVSRRVNVALME